ncbi:transcriptional regulator, GntR family [Methylobacterium sp. 4-46]|uniref:GntR family transcriptional regulator n=1 Tax=unclassified Methylobacterium TaxID=2615210 RepID=UPI000165C97A|nr:MULTISPECIES: GntR family transcriptional regulator [Methylobacterium]ACA17869.1 transcriptional regulator, GntR family [Methylobacterium sp. 4-46]WFT77171.1 GntR family transcriptional regulator [Methylobacterium nodulans]
MTRVETGISRRYLHDEVAERLRALILSGELEPRARLNEILLTERFGISRTPLREAIKILATEGLLELLPNRGARVASISTQEIEEILEVVAALEALAGELACRHITEAELEAIAAHHAAMVEAWRREDDPAYFTLNRRIHEAIMAASRNATLASLYAGLSGRIQRARYSAHKTPEQWRRAVEEHDAMLAHLRARDGEALARVMRAHIRGKKPVIAAAYGSEAGN